MSLRSRLTSFSAVPPLIVSGAALMSAATLLAAEPARTVLVLPLVMLLPGWALLRAVTGSDDRRDAGLVIGLSAMLSIALLVAIALALSAGSVPLRARNFVIGVDAVLVVLALVVHARERVAGSRAEQPGPSAGRGLSRIRFPTRWIAVGAAFAVLGGTFAALLATYSSVRPVEANDNPWIGLSLVGPAAHTDAVLRRTPGEGVQLPVQVSNRTRSTREVKVLVQVDGGAWRPTQPQVVGSNASTVEQVTLSAPKSPGLHQVVLAIDGSPGVPAASVDTWILVTPQSR